MIREDIQWTKIPGVRLIPLTVYRDQRGFFSEVFRENFVQLNYSWSQFGTLRGLHYQPGMAKVIHCPIGEIFDVVFDLETGKHVSVVLDKDHALYVPAGLAHGFLSLKESHVVYACTEMYDKEKDFGVHWTSGDIVWPFPPVVISEKDKNLERWRQ